MEALRLLIRASVSGACTKDTCPASDSICELTLTERKLPTLNTRCILTAVDTDGYAPSWNFNLFFTVNFAISALVFYHQAFIWPKWRAYSLACAIGCLMEAGGQ